MVFRFGVAHWVLLLFVAAAFYWIGARNPNVVPYLGTGGGSVTGAT